MGKKVKVDFGGVDKEIKSGGKSSRVPEGDYLGKVVKGELKRNKAKDGKYFAWRIQVVAPKQFKGKTLYLNTSLKPEALWNLRNLIYACTGKNVAGKALGFDPDALTGKVFAFTAVDDEYENPDTHKKTIKSQVEDVRPKAELKPDGDDDEDEEDEEETEEEETEEEDDDDLEDVDVEDL